MPREWLSDKEIGQKIRRLRKDLQLTQAGLASEIGLDGGQSDVSKWEIGKEGVPRSALISIAQLGGVSIEHFQVAQPDSKRAEMMVVVRWLDRMANELRASTGIVKSGDRPRGRDALKQRFLASISAFTDVQVEDICGLNHETVRQYRKGDWPENGPTRASARKIRMMIAEHEAIMQENAILSGDEDPPFATDLIEFAEHRESIPSFVEKYPKLGWIYLADDLAKFYRKLDRMTIYDEIMWLGYKRAHHFDPETASRVTLEDVGLDASDFIMAIVKRAESNQ